MTQQSCFLGLFCAQSLSRVQLFVTSWTEAHQAPLSMGILQAYWSGLPCPPPEGLPNPGMESRSPALQANSLPTATREALLLGIYLKKLKIQSTQKPAQGHLEQLFFKTAKTWKQPRCLSVGEWVNSPWFIQTMEYYSALKRNELSSHVKKRCQSEKSTSYMIPTI